MEENRLDFSLVATLLNEDMNSLLKTQLHPLIHTSRLYDATIKADLNSLHDLLSQDPLILDRCIIKKSGCFMQSPLHVAASLGHLEFTAEILRLKPELAKQADESTKSSALHLASEKGHLDVVKKLVEVMPNMCFARDQDGHNPIHVAAINNQLHVLVFLARTNPRAARETTNAHETLLHLCVKYAQLELLKYSLHTVGELLNAKDNGGNTVLHLAVVFQQPEVVKLLVSNKKMQQNALNKNGLTARDCLVQTGRSVNLKDMEIGRMLKRAKVEKRKDKDGKWLNKQRNSLMVVASVIATMAFQFGLNPDWKNQYSEHAYRNLTVVNTISLVSSLGVVLVLIGGLPCKRLFVIPLMITMWVSITSTLWTYFMYLAHPSSPMMRDAAIMLTLTISACVWVILLILLILGHLLRIVIKSAKKLVKKLVCVLWTDYCHGPLVSPVIP